MQYRKFGNTGVSVSSLGFGCMRFPVTQSTGGKEAINEPEAIKMLRYGIDNGINYIDTAYIYHDGMSESLVGKALRGGYREKVYLATKSPTWMINKPEDFDSILDEQLRRLETSYIDFYLLHALDADKWENVIQKFDILGKAEKALSDGRIRHIGFSFHDGPEAFLTILNGYDKWDFCQIQMNYIDINNQATMKGLEAASEKGLGVIIMEPLLGGKLAKPSENVAAALSNEKTPVEWALDFLWNRPETGLILSGMSSMQQTVDNILYAGRSHVDMLTEKNLLMLQNVKIIYDTMALVACTKCAYCMPCPFGLDIPGTFELYNRTAVKDMAEIRNDYQRMDLNADACKTCRKCESLCPQHIKISDVMKRISGLFQPEPAAGS